jgi:hypothetical protein
MPDWQNHLSTPLEIFGAQNQIWLLGLGLFEEQLSTVAPNSALQVGNLATSQGR